MSSLPEIEAAIRQLPPDEVDELLRSLDQFRMDRTLERKQLMKDWLRNAVGKGKTIMSTDEVMALTRGEE